MQRFYTMTGTELQSTSTPIPSSASVSEETEESSEPKAIKSNPESTAEETNKVRGTLKRLMVPELPPPHDHIMESIKSPTPQQVDAIRANDKSDNYDELLSLSMDADKAESSIAQSADAEQQEQKPKKKFHITNWLLSGVIIFLIVLALLYYLVQR
jgi:hypothetical protein